MKRLLLVVALILGMSFIFIGPASATNENTDKVCYDKVLDKEAYDETVIVEEAVPAVPEVLEVSHIVKHPEETKVVTHDEVSHLEYHFAKFTRERTKKGNGAWSEYGAWSKWSPETHTSWELNNAPLGSPQFHSEGTRAGGIKWERQWQAMFDGTTRKIVDKPAYDETVVVKEAYDEKVIDQEYVPAVPGKDAVTKVVHHDATYKDVEVPCEVVVPPLTPPTEEPKGEIDKPIKKDSPKKEKKELTVETPVETYEEVDQVLPNAGGPELGYGIGGVALVLSGGALLLGLRRRRSWN